MKSGVNLMNMIEIKNLKKQFGNRTAVNGINLSIKEGEIFGILGPNGAGKSTTLSLICKLQKATEGNIAIGGWDINKNTENAKKLIGIVPQEPALYPQLSARNNLKFWATLNNVKVSEIDNAINNTLKCVGLEDRADEPIQKYSGGMKRRLNIAAGIVHSPKLLIMDEPTVGVDPQSRSHILEAIKNLKNQGTTILYTSHYVDEVEYLCDRVAIMDHGKIISIGTVAELLNQSREFQELLITINQLSETSLDLLQGFPTIKSISILGNTISILTASAEKVLPLVFETLVNQGIQVQEIKILKPNLESLFLKLTGRALRD